MSNPQQQKLNSRALVSLTMLFSFVWLPPSGIILHLTDRAEVSQLRHAAMAVHNFAGIIFLVAALIHIFYNIKPIKQYVVAKAHMFSQLKREAIIAFIITTALILLFASHAFHVH
ncbi:MAG: DUF4405 domain-containing protein [Candidatus Aminicenantes bacterium]|nr:DUF4405 domain-containing protein [Candidatus Aminicenantes bacterium]